VSARGDAERAPLFTASMALASWLVKTLDREPGVLPAAIVRDGLRLLEALTLALKDRDRLARLDDADERLIALRLKLRLASETGLLSDRQAMHALEQANDIGRQLGAWLRSLEQA
jgi:hypothetical protein